MVSIFKKRKLSIMFLFPHWHTLLPTFHFSLNFYLRVYVNIESTKRNPNIKHDLEFSPFIPFSSILSLHAFLFYSLFLSSLSPLNSHVLRKFLPIPLNISLLLIPLSPHSCASIGVFVLVIIFLCITDRAECLQSFIPRSFVLVFIH